MTTINNLNDLNRLVAETVFCPEPPRSERRAIHKSGAWRWNPNWRGCNRSWCRPEHEYRGCMAAGMATGDCPAERGHWEPAPFATDPAASYALEQRLNRECYAVVMGQSMVTKDPTWSVLLINDKGQGKSPSVHNSRLIAICLAALRALGVEFELGEGWDK